MKQRRLKKRDLIALITILSMVPPLSTDLYMPGLPEIVAHFQTTTSLASFTMTVFFIFMAFGTLVLGPVSDKFGRKPVLIWSTVSTLVCSIVCAAAPTITFLIGVRAIQAFGAGGMIAIGSALVKDSFEGPEMGKVLSISQALVFIAPVAAPILGALILEVSNWSMTFVALAALNAITLALVLLLDETLPKAERIRGSTLHSIFGLFKVVKNPVFTSLLLAGGILTAPFMAYIAIASYVYINEFHTSETIFSMYFAVTSALAAAGPLLYVRMGKKPFHKVMWICHGVAALAGGLLLTIGKVHPVLFLMSFIPFAVMGTYLRTYMSELLLNAQQENIGAASAAMNFGYTILGSLGMVIGSLPWSGYVSGLAFTIFIFAALALSIFIVANKFRVFNF